MQRSWRTWAAVGGMLVVGVVGVGLVLAANGDDGDGAPAATPTGLTGAEADMSAAVKQADVRVDGVSASEVEELIRLLCTTQDADEAAAQIVALGVGRSPDVQDVVEGVGRGAEGFCPAVAGEEPTLLNDVYNGALKLIAETSTTASG